MRREKHRFPKLPAGFKARLYIKEKRAMRKMMELEELHEDPIAPDLRTFPELEHDWLSKMWRVSWWEPSEKLRKKIVEEEKRLRR